MYTVGKRKSYEWVGWVGAGIIVAILAYFAHLSAERTIEGAEKQQLALDLGKSAWMGDCIAEIRKPIDECAFSWDRSPTLREHYVKERQP